MAKAKRAFQRLPAAAASHEASGVDVHSSARDGDGSSSQAANSVRVSDASGTVQARSSTSLEKSSGAAFSEHSNIANSRTQGVRVRAGQVQGAAGQVPPAILRAFQKMNERLDAGGGSVDSGTGQEESGRVPVRGEIPSRQYSQVIHVAGQESMGERFKALVAHSDVHERTAALGARSGVNAASRFESPVEQEANENVAAWKEAPGVHTEGDVASQFRSLVTKEMKDQVVNERGGAVLEGIEPQQIPSKIMATFLAAGLRSRPGAAAGVQSDRGGASQEASPEAVADTHSTRASETHIATLRDGRENALDMHNARKRAGHEVGRGQQENVVTKSDEGATHEGAVQEQVGDRHRGEPTLPELWTARSRIVQERQREMIRSRSTNHDVHSARGVAMPGVEGGVEASSVGVRPSIHVSWNDSAISKDRKTSLEGGGAAARQRALVGQLESIEGGLVQEINGIKKILGH